MKVYPQWLKTQLLLGVVVAAALLVCGCAGRAVNSRLRELDAQLTPLVGQHKEVVLQVLGPPQDNFATGQTEVWKYHISYGAKSRDSRNLFTGEYLGTTRSWEQYDQYELTIVNDTVRTFRTYVQR